MVDDLQKALVKIDYKIKPWDIVLIQTGADKLWGKPEYFDAGCGMTRDSTLWLIEQGIRVMGIDAWRWAPPFWAIKEEFRRTGDRSVLWGAHYAGMDKEYCHIEKLANLDQLPRPFGFKVACFPVKLTGGSAGWNRVVAVLEDCPQLPGILSVNAGLTEMVERIRCLFAAGKNYLRYSTAIYIISPTMA